VLARQLCSKVNLKIREVDFVANLIVLESKGIDVILGMDWLSKQKVLIDYAKKSVKLQEHRLYAKLSKCEFWMKQVALLGHVISKGGISVDPGKVQDVLSWNAPMSVGDIQSFLGLARYY
jgi:hypothetical protein